MNKHQLASELAEAGVKLFEEKQGVPAYKSPAVLISTATTALETIGTFFGFPGVGAAVSVILSAIFRKKIDRLGLKQL